MTLKSATNFTVKETTTITWPVIEFSTQNGNISSPTFITPSNSNRFLLRLDLTDKPFANRCTDHVYIYLWSSVPEIAAKFRISILDTKDKKHFTREFVCDFVVDSRVVVNFIQRGMCKPFLVNDTLIIYCEIDVLIENPQECKESELEGSFGSPCDDYRALLKSGKLSDFTIVVDDKKFLVHKAILSARSAVFGAMFEQDTQEVKDGKMVICDMRLEVVEGLIRYIYCGQIESLNENASELFVAADMYQLDHLKSICEQSLIESLSIESVCSILALADMHNAVEFKSKCIQFMIDNYDKVMATDGWKSCWTPIEWI